MAHVLAPSLKEHFVGAIPLEYEVIFEEFLFVVYLNFSSNKTPIHCDGLCIKSKMRSRQSRICDDGLGRSRF